MLRGEEEEKRGSSYIQECQTDVATVVMVGQEVIATSARVRFGRASTTMSGPPTMQLQVDQRESANETAGSGYIGCREEAVGTMYNDSSENGTGKAKDAGIDGGRQIIEAPRAAEARRNWSGQAGSLPVVFQRPYLKFRH